MKTKGYVALWTFDEAEGQLRKSEGKEEFPLQEMGKPVPRMDEGPLSEHSLLLDGNNYLKLANDQTGKLNILGKSRAVTVVAWIKWSGEGTGFVGGMWNEYQDGGRRQYGLFVNLPYYNGRNQVCGHISQTGKATPPFPYSIDYSASAQEVPVGKWACIAMTYDGTYIKSYLNGVFEPRELELIAHTAGFDGYPEGLMQSKNPYYFAHGMGDNGSDFTVGAVLLKRGMGNHFIGQLGGLAVFDRALSEKELIKLSQ